ncbi:MAG TPA: MerR family transcriptional regulator [Caulobacteraceae bacterium]|nr:MerR family transcriptional regulator [Caulobacteraceae bacterium]
MKGPEAFRSISEASDALGVPQHVLRFWETKFSFIRPMKRAGGRRFYRPQDLAVLAEVRRLLHEEGYTIKGVQKLHRELGAKRFAAGEAPEPPPEEQQFEPAPEAEAPVSGGAATASAGALDEAARRRLTEALEALEAAKARLDDLLGGD